ncbi:FAD-dependent oxidoreductase [Flavihumibacter sp. RY-1]|uniref:FAD-dependent oxidoreductase n=1 Tax=Flavihumibacter fluminis TaxID=2909236 RepID=A0ABS9BMC5_9BACT|nr:FAD-dependent oxidoreductase [Flavihumibacter fluminis]MCF1716359.1 FAD-dependent oxidoreductase [Flavihumibacter fluminis]
MFRIFFLLFIPAFLQAQEQLKTEVLVIGGGTGGTAAAIQSARLKTRTILVEPGPWLGGMLTAAGVSATDGNHRLPSGLWEEFRHALRNHYGSADALATGWVSNTQFEPHVGDNILKAMASREKKHLTVMHGWEFDKVLKEGNRILGAQFRNVNGKLLIIRASVTIDATELGDVLAAAQLPYSLGMEAESETGEQVGVDKTSNIVQDLTYVAILKDYGRGVDCTIVKPAGYDPAEFDGACTDFYLNTSLPKPSVNAEKMLEYGKLPGNKYMLNWPNQGNDTYLELVELSPAERIKELEKAKATTLRFIYFIQHQLGFKHLGLAVDEFPTGNGFALMPYHREGRRVKGAVRFTINHIADPYGNGQPLYRTGISVGDYPIDHHHKKNPAAPQHLYFYPIPSYAIPMGALIAPGIEGFIVADKSISVSNVVNGTTRLQPVVLLTGQAAGAMASLAVKERKAPDQLSVRKVQQLLLDQKAMIQPFLDVPPSHPQFQAIHRVGATGLLKGKGIPFQWANQTWFYPDSTIQAQDFLTAWKEFKGQQFANSLWLETEEGVLTINTAFYIIQAGDLAKMKSYWKKWGLQNFDPNRPITKKELAVLLDQLIKPFERPVNLKGEW